MTVFFYLYIFSLFVRMDIWSHVCSFFMGKGVVFVKRLLFFICVLFFFGMPCIARASDTILIGDGGGGRVVLMIQ